MPKKLKFKLLSSLVQNLRENMIEEKIEEMKQSREDRLVRNMLYVFKKKVTDVQENKLENYTVDALDTLIGEDLINVIQSLPKGYRTIFNMYVVEGYAHKEIAEKMDISVGTSKWHVSNARKILRGMLEKAKSKTNYYTTA